MTLIDWIAQHQETLSWIGGGVATAAGGAWVVVRYMMKRKPPKKTDVAKIILSDTGNKYIMLWEDIDERVDVEAIVRLAEKLPVPATAMPPPSEEAYINLRFEDDDDHQTLDVNTGLIAEHVYRLYVGLGPEIDPLEKGP